jgi:polar amino acid transport system substrate-binding protein
MLRHAERSLIATGALAVLLVLGAMDAPHADEPMRFVLNEAQAAPLVLYEGDKPVGGIVYDIGKALGAALGIPVQFVNLPRKRIDAAAIAGDIDLRCYLNPAWTEFADQYVWSEILFGVSDVLVGGEQVPEPKSLADLPGKTRITTVLGYIYPTLAPLFDSGHAIRDDAADQEKVLLMVSGGRNPYAVSNSLGLAWYQRITPRHALASWRLELSRYDIHCAVPKKGAIPADTINDALAKLKADGEIEKILARYR